MQGRGGADRQIAGLHKDRIARCPNQGDAGVHVVGIQGKMPYSAFFRPVCSVEESVMQRLHGLVDLLGLDYAGDLDLTIEVINFYKDFFGYEMSEEYANVVMQGKDVED